MVIKGIRFVEFGLTNMFIKETGKRHSKLEKGVK